ncbi:Prophage baseplate assembly protein V [Alloalcanivorax xenomutans]|uniref:phage baseplate assembly protein V n=1 Tax=Alloalcanivorax xenomutans TaxID=1094342 RepID=UPI0006D5C21D|nr:phage baseplate assembly protein V [Alloalcanivorax xenomutans]CUR45499.1 Prophage baseplate assembly protein V [Alloalcanivorax xenomutans]
MRVPDLIRRLASAGRLLRVDDSPQVQVVQVELLAGEIRNLQRLQDYGITSVPLPGAEGVAVSLNGQRGRTVMLKVDDRRYRPVDLEPGDTCLYTHEGTVVHLQKGQKILVEGATQVTVKSAGIVLDGPVQCTKTLNVAGLITGQAGLTITGAAAQINGATLSEAGNLTTAAGTSVDGHSHNESGGGTTSEPI